MRGDQIRWIAMGAAALLLAVCLLCALVFLPGRTPRQPENAQLVGQPAVEVQE
ncbi:MAG: hypothetical protein PHD32_02565 [Eubacteriales bacterium]|nr:hypothetical protein [Eubacteriales bacterium]